MKKNTLLLLIFLFAYNYSYSQKARVVGYLPTYRFENSNQIDYCRLTHLYLSFANPDSDGNIVMTSISSVMADALNDNPELKILVSVAGGALSAQQANDWSNLIDNPSNRPAFIAKIVDFVSINNLDGIDIDLEWGHVTSGYSDFVVELKAALNGKLITAAFPNQTLFSNITPVAIAAFDFINIMSYDATGPWTPASPGQHSTYSYAQNGIAFWKNTVGVPASKLNLGLPMYGYDFVNSSTVSAFSYGQMVNTNSSYADLDNVGSAYYNGRPTIQSKVELANDEIGGVFVWELGQDAFNQYSLLTSIHDKYTSLGVLTSAMCGNEVVLSSSVFQDKRELAIYPNPSSDYLSVSNITNEQYFNVYNIMGNQIIEGFVAGKNQICISQLNDGIYFLQFDNGSSLKFMKK